MLFAHYIIVLLYDFFIRLLFHYCIIVLFHQFCSIMILLYFYMIRCLVYYCIVLLYVFTIFLSYDYMIRLPFISLLMLCTSTILFC